MTYKSQYGQPEGLADRLLEHVHRLGTDKMKPWAGMGIIDDLRCAAEQLRGPTNHAKPVPKGEYDL